MTRARWGVAALLAAGLAACGDEGLDREALGDRADAICASYAEQTSGLGRPDLANPEAAEEYFTRAEEFARRQQDELEALEPAEEIAGDYDRLTAATAESTRLLGDLAAAARDRDRARSAELFQRLPELVTRVDDAALAVDADSCAS